MWEKNCLKLFMEALVLFGLNVDFRCRINLIQKENKRKKSLALVLIYLVRVGIQDLRKTIHLSASIKEGKRDKRLQNKIR